MQVESDLFARGHLTMPLDGDNVRHGLNNNLGFSAADRAENVRRVGEVAKLAAESGVIVIASFISPYRQDRDAVRSRVASSSTPFYEVFCRAPLALCESRDPKGLYRKAREGQLKHFTGIDDPYEEPERAEIVLEAFGEGGRIRTPQELSAQILEVLEDAGIIPAVGTWGKQEKGEQGTQAPRKEAEESLVDAAR